MTVGFGPVDGWFLTGPNSKMERVEAGNNHFWNGMLVFFCGKMLGKNPVFFDWAMLFFVSLTVTVGFGPVDGWFLTGPNSKLERVSASWQQITFGTECWIFLWQDVGKESSLLTGLCIFVW